VTHPATARDDVLDSAKFLLMVLVVVGHAVEPLLAGREIKAGYLLIYAFHMPLFALLCGRFSRAGLDGPRAGRLLAGVVLPYVLFETGYALFNAVLWRRAPDVSLLAPYWLMWFLFALALWRAALPYLARLRWPLAFAVAASVLVPFTGRAGNDAVYRTLGLLPFFVLGHLLPPGFHRRLRRRRVRAAGLAAFAAAAVACWLLAPGANEVWVYWRGSYASLAAPGVAGPLIRVALLLVGALLSLAFLAWVPESRPLARLGRRTMYVFLLHGFVVLAARRAGWYDAVDSWPAVLAVVVAAGCLAAALASPVVRRVFRPVVEPAAGWLLADDRGTDRGADPGGDRGGDPRGAPGAGVGRIPAQASRRSREGTPAGRRPVRE
jgi:fucose 4-O-acetylase-like acetyltransferase